MSTHDHGMRQDPGLVLGHVLGLLVLCVVLVSYLAAVAHQRRHHRSWSAWRSFAFCTGIGLAALGVSPLISQYARSDLQGHMVQHLFLGMFAPLALVMAAPLTLLLRTASARTGRVIASVFRMGPVHMLSHPVTAMLLNVGSMYLLYMTSLFAWSLGNPTLHHLINIHFLAAGYMFAWSIAGPDSAPRRPGMRLRIIVLVASIGLHALLSKLMYVRLWPQGTEFSPDEVRTAAVTMYYGGDVAEILLAIALFATWYHRRRLRRQLAEVRNSNRSKYPPAQAAE
jgi:putative membrane protein